MKSNFSRLFLLSSIAPVPLVAWSEHRKWQPFLVPCLSGASDTDALTQVFDERIDEELDGAEKLSS
jgi:hypothetical protein